MFAILRIPTFVCDLMTFETKRLLARADDIRQQLGAEIEGVGSGWGNRWEVRMCTKWRVSKGTKTIERTKTRVIYLGRIYVYTNVSTTNTIVKTLKVI